MDGITFSPWTPEKQTLTQTAPLPLLLLTELRTSCWKDLGSWSLVLVSSQTLVGLEACGDLLGGAYVLSGGCLMSSLSGSSSFMPLAWARNYRAEL